MNGSRGSDKESPLEMIVTHNVKNSNSSLPLQTCKGCAIASSTKSADFKPVLSLWALILFGIAFVGPTAPYTFFGIGAARSHGHFATVYLIALIAVSFTAISYGKM